jgi:hypothetical protein
MGTCSGYELDLMEFHTAGMRMTYGRLVIPSGSPHPSDEDRSASLQKGSVAASLGSSRASTATSFLPSPSRPGKNHQMYGRTHIISKEKNSGSRRLRSPLEEMSVPFFPQNISESALFPVFSGGRRVPRPSLVEVLSRFAELLPEA